MGEPSRTDYKAVCFVDMPFGKKPDLTSGVIVDFDSIYELAIEPAISEAGLEPVRGDKEQTGGIIHVPMFARMLLAEFMIADLTLSNPNVFYELGIRHAIKPFTTVPIFATTGSLPFDVGMVRSIGYELKDGQLTGEGAEKLKTAKCNERRGTENPIEPTFIHENNTCRILVDEKPLDGAGLARPQETAWVDPAVQLWNRTREALLRSVAGAPVRREPKSIAGIAYFIV
jgi:hypothetical protein